MQNPTVPTCRAAHTLIFNRRFHWAFELTGWETEFSAKWNEKPHKNSNSPTSLYMKIFKKRSKEKWEWSKRVCNFCFIMNQVTHFVFSGRSLSQRSKQEKNTIRTMFLFQCLPICFPLLLPTSIEPSSAFWLRSCLTLDHHSNGQITSF